MGVRLAGLSVEVAVIFAGEPLLAAGSALRAEAPDADTAALLRRAVERSAVSNSVSRGVPVTVPAA
jgi:hypothetical protein